MLELEVIVHLILRVVSNHTHKKYKSQSIRKHIIHMYVYIYIYISIKIKIIFSPGGVVHPPKPRDHGTLLQRNVRELGVRSALSTKYAQNQFIIVDKIKLKTHKTKDFLSILEKNAWDPFGKNQTEGDVAQQRINRVEGHSILFLTREHKKELDLASRNLQKVHALTANEIFEMSDVYNILGHEVLIIEKDAIQDFENLLRPL